MTVYGIITAAGEGTRMRALTNRRLNRHARPKAMLPVGTSVLIDYSINALKNIDLDVIYVGTGPRPFSESLERRIINRHTYEIEIKVHAENELLDTAGTVKYLLQNIIENVKRSDTICVLPCDTPHNIDLSPILKAHEDKGAAATVAALPIEWGSPVWREHRFGTISFQLMNKVEDYKGDRNLFELDNMNLAQRLQGESVRVTRYQNHQERDKAESNLVNTGIYFFNAGFLMDLAPHITPKNARPQFSDIGLHVFALLGGRSSEFPFIPEPFVKKVLAGEYPFNAYLLPPDVYWRDVGNPLALLKANMDFLTGKLRVPLEENDRFWHPEPWGLMGNFGTRLPGDWHKIVAPPMGTLGSVIGNHVQPSGRIDTSVVLDYMSVEGKVASSICFPGTDHEIVDGRPTIRRGIIGSGTTLVNCIFTGGDTRQIPTAEPIHDRIVYETAYGGLAFDPL